MKSENVILIGFMGTGKSTIGRLLAEKLGYMFTDTDKRIVEEQGVSIAELFNRLGELAFRGIEQDVLRRVIAKGHQVIATGGGAVLSKANRETMLQGGFVVALKADQATIIKRVSGDSARPLLQGGVEERVAFLLEERKHAYDFADHIIDTSKFSPQQVVELIISEKKKRQKRFSYD